jgi:iron complex transport system substrate-binding protein
MRARRVRLPVIVVIVPLAISLLQLVVTSSQTPQRIVSLAPGITEMVFALGLGNRLVGVTTACRYPEAALRVPKIGGSVTPSLDALSAARPDLTLLLSASDDVRERVSALGIPLLRVDYNSLDGILESATLIGERCGAGRQAAALRASWQQELDAITKTVANRPRPRVLICLGRGQAPSTLRSISVAEPGGIYHDLIVHAGGVNAIPQGQVLHPSISAEALVRLDPDVIVEFAPNADAPYRLRDDWRALHALRAVKNGRVYVFTQDFLSAPGPRLVRFVGELARALHPDVDWRHL